LPWLIVLKFITIIIIFFSRGFFNFTETMLHNLQLQRAYLNYLV